MKKILSIFIFLIIPLSLILITLWKTHPKRKDLLHADKKIFWLTLSLVIFWIAFFIYRHYHPFIPWLDRDYGTNWSYE